MASPTGESSGFNHMQRVIPLTGKFTPVKIQWLTGWNAEAPQGIGLWVHQHYVPVIMEITACAVAKGRPREFDTDSALTAALRVFWSKGYEGASLSDLTEAMGITRPSLYAAFGNKEALFRKTLDLYQREKLDYMGKALDAPTARGVAERLLIGALEMQMSSCDPKGCMGVINSVACGAEAESIRAEVLKRGAIVKQGLIDRFERAKDEGDLPPIPM